MKKSLVFFFFFSFSVSSAEYLKFNSYDKRHPNYPEVLVEISFPKKTSGKLPLIISQHGSTRDGKKFKGGATDEYSTRIIKAGTKAGFAVAVIDAFYKKPVKPTDKTIFPTAAEYAYNLRKLLLNDSRFDRNNFFYTGFSYGASQVLKGIGTPYNEQHPNAWRAISSAEPACNKIHQPIKLSFPVLIIKGEESHYYIEPCQILENELLKSKSKVKLVIIPKVNHFFSTNGTINKGIAMNGCRYNPIIQMPNKTFKMYDGTPISKKETITKCLTKESGSGKNRKKLDEAVNLTINFFKENLN